MSVRKVNRPEDVYADGEWFELIKDVKTTLVYYYNDGVEYVQGAEVVETEEDAKKVVSDFFKNLGTEAVDNLLEQLDEELNGFPNIVIITSNRYDFSLTYNLDFNLVHSSF